MDLSSKNADYPKISSYVFSAASGTLDYALGNANAAAALSGDVVHYNINADEPVAKDYNQEFCNCVDCKNCEFKQVMAKPVRASDHDPLYADFVFMA
jgi:uncharacterized protein